MDQTVKPMSQFLQMFSSVSQGHTDLEALHWRSPREGCLLFLRSLRVLSEIYNETDIGLLSFVSFNSSPVLLKLSVSFLCLLFICFIFNNIQYRDNKIYQTKDSVLHLHQIPGRRCVPTSPECQNQKQAAGKR